MKVFSREEVLLHNNINDCWIILYNEVYDVTSFLQSHPGGADIILSRAGEDATSFFTMKHGNSDRVKKMLSKYKIGKLAAHQIIAEDSFSEPFIAELLNEISIQKLYRVSEDVKKKFFFVRSFAVIFFFILSFCALYLSGNIVVSIILVLIQAIIGTSLFGLIAHEATHRNYPYQPSLKKALKVVWPIFWPFISQKPLYYEHNSHHFKIGDPHYDFEVAGFSDFIRYSGTVQHKPIHKFQHRLALFFYPFYANIITTYGGAMSKFWSSHNRNVVFQHGLSIIVTFLFYIIIPSIVNENILRYIFLYFIYQCLLYYGIYVGAAINHFTTSSNISIPKDMENLYGYYVCRNTTNFRTFHPFWFWYTGGFNVQIEHHLVPFIPVENLHKLVPIVKRLCVKYNYPYIEHNTFRALWNDHYTYLQILSNPKSSVEVLDETTNKIGYQPR